MIEFDVYSRLDIMKIEHFACFFVFLVEFGVLHVAAHLDTRAYVKNCGYPFEEYDVETVDGYVLALHRVPGSPQAPNGTYKGVAFLMHGLLGSSENWLILGPPKALAFYLADRGYDVWMGNARGTTHSRRHKTLSTDDADFWNFDWHEIGVYDVPAMLDAVTNVTGVEKMFYIGHSQGTTSFFVMGSERPEYMEKIKLFVALAPVVYLSNTRHPLVQVLANFVNTIGGVAGAIGVNEVVPNNDLLKMLGTTFCQNNAIFTEVCANLLFLIAGYNSVQLDREMLPLIAETAPAGASLKQFEHFGQIIKTDLYNSACNYFAKGLLSIFSPLCTKEFGTFTKFDYGASKNLQLYGQLEAPLYNLNNVDAPTLLIYANNDLLVSTKDVEHLASQLPNVIDLILVRLYEFNHLDFIFARDADTLVYPDVYRYMELYK